MAINENPNQPKSQITDSKRNSAVADLLQMIATFIVEFEKNSHHIAAGHYDIKKFADLIYGLLVTQLRDGVVYAQGVSQAPGDAKQETTNKKDTRQWDTENAWRLHEALIESRLKAKDEMVDSGEMTTQADKPVDMSDKSAISEDRLKGMIEEGLKLAERMKEMFKSK